MALSAACLDDMADFIDCVEAVFRGDEFFAGVIKPDSSLEDKVKRVTRFIESTIDDSQISLFCLGDKKLTDTLSAYNGPSNLEFYRAWEESQRKGVKFPSGFKFEKKLYKLNVSVLIGVFALIKALFYLKAADEASSRKVYPSFRDFAHGKIHGGEIRQYECGFMKLWPQQKELVANIVADWERERFKDMSTMIVSVSGAPSIPGVVITPPASAPAPSSWWPSWLFGGSGVKPPVLEQATNAASAAPAAKSFSLWGGSVAEKENVSVVHADRPGVN